MSATAVSPNGGGLGEAPPALPDPGAQILMMRSLTQKGYIEGDNAVAFALKREYQHRIAQRKLTYRRLSS